VYFLPLLRPSLITRKKNHEQVIYPEGWFELRVRENSGYSARDASKRLLGLFIFSRDNPMRAAREINATSKKVTVEFYLNRIIQGRTTRSLKQLVNKD
jgi:hypothetical protein